ncbi:MAG TPA: cysteine--tRNA ligase [Candidatus Dojkabacteria bacterium]|nr:cysteine--tRNA ligase [Candidatus Dojkabacteria bacterium]
MKTKIILTPSTSHPVLIYNSLSRKKEKFIPIEEGKLKMYHCGPTVYWIQHIGNMRAVVISDIIRKTFEFLGYDVKFTRNYTDVGHLTGDNIGDADIGEDRMEKGAKREGLTPDEIANKYIDLFDKHTKLMNAKDPTYKTRATHYIKEMQALVQILLDKGYAYEKPKAVYFDVDKFDDYNNLNKQKLDKNIKGAGTGDLQDPDKKNPYDFALWVFKTGVHKNAMQHWPSPFNSPEVENGEGFPGWHIECSAMSKATLGDTVDIHMGGIEHISIHHTNEIAQSQCANGVPPANYWVHNEHLLVDNGKMSKSLGNVYSVDDVIAKGFDTLDLRYLFLLAHYRSKQNFTWKSLESAKQARNKILQTVAQILSEKRKKRGKKSKTQHSALRTKHLNEFIQHITDDFDIPGAVATMWELIKDETVDNDEKLNTLLAFDTVFDIGIRGTRDRIANFSDKMIEEVNELIAQRNKYRKEKQWEQADKIRTELDKKGIKIEDTSNGTVWY